jgi:hypothetical protein
MPPVIISAIGMVEKWNGGMMDKKNLRLEFIFIFVKPGFQYSMIPGETVQ